MAKTKKFNRAPKHAMSYEIVPVFEEKKKSNLSWRDYHLMQDASSGGDDREIDYPNLMFMREYVQVLMPVRY